MCAVVATNQVGFFIISRNSYTYKWNAYLLQLLLSYQQVRTMQATKHMVTKIVYLLTIQIKYSTAEELLSRVNRFR